MSRIAGAVPAWFTQRIQSTSPNLIVLHCHRSILGKSFSRFPNLGSRQKANRDPNDWQITHSSPAQCPLSCMLSPAIRPPKNTPAITLFLFGKPLRRQKDAPPSPCGDSRTTQRTKLFSGRPRPRARSCQTFSLGIRVRFFLPPWRRCARLPRQGSFARRRADRTRLTQRRGVSKRQAGATMTCVCVCVRVRPANVVAFSV